MTYAIVQQELVMPEVDQLKRAFNVSPRLTALDAQTASCASSPRNRIP